MGAPGDGKAEEASLKILHVIETLGRGGAENLLLTVLPALRERGHDCEVAVLWPPYDLAAELEQRGVRVFRLDIRHRWHLPGALRGLLPILRNGYHVVHTHLYFASFYASLASFLSPRYGRVVTFHNCDWESYPARTLLHRLKKGAEGYLMRNRTDCRLAVTPAVAKSYREQLSVTGVKVIRNSVDATLLGEVNPPRAEVLSAFGVREQELVVTVPGRFVHEKGHKYLLQALQLLNGKGCSPRVIVVGEGPLKDELYRIFEEGGLLPQVVFSPALPHPELMALVKVSDLVVLPSTHEGLPIIALETMALGTPVIASAVGGLKDLFEHGVTGLLVPPADPPALCDAMLEMIGSPEKRRTLASKARLKVVSEFDVRQVIAGLEESYRAACGAYRPGAR